MINLLQETIKAIQSSGHTEHDIVFIGSMDSGHQCTWAQFATMADVEYDEDFGRQNVARDLVIVFADSGRLARHDYDGEEEWKHIKPFRMPEETHPVRTLVRNDLEKNSGYAKTLAELNGDR
jgi:hypothetical protein